MKKIFCLIVLSLFLISCKESPTETNPDITTVNLKMVLNNGNYELSWQSLGTEDFLHYTVYRRNSDTSAWIKLETQFGTVFSDTSLRTMNGEYQFEYSLTYGTKRVGESEHSPVLKIAILNDNFNDNINRWDDPNDPEDDSGIVENGQLKIPSRIGRNDWLMEGYSGWDNVTIEVDALSEQNPSHGPDPAYGIAFRINRADSVTKLYEFFIFHNKAIQLAVYKTDDWRTISEIPKSYNIYAWNTIHLEIRGEGLKAVINGETSMTDYIGELNKGKIALTSQDGIATWFDNVRVLVTGPNAQLYKKRYQSDYETPSIFSQKKNSIHK